MEHPPRNLGASAFNWRKLILLTDLPSNAKYLALYLATYMNDHQDMAWPSLKRIEGETGLAHATVIKWLSYLCEEGWLVKQSGSRTESNKYFISIPNEVGQSLTYVNQCTRVGQPLTSNNNRITNIYNKGRSKFVKPTVDEINSYINEKNLSVDGQRFFDYYESGDWKDKDGKPVKNWKQRLISWDGRGREASKPTKKSTSTKERSLADDLNDTSWAH